MNVEQAKKIVLEKHPGAQPEWFFSRRIICARKTPSDQGFGWFGRWLSDPKRTIGAAWLNAAERITVHKE